MSRKVRNSHNMFWCLKPEEPSEQAKDEEAHCHTINLVIIMMRMRMIMMTEMVVVMIIIRRVVLSEKIPA